MDAGITFIDLAPSYGNGEAESVVGEAFGGRVPSGVRVSTKHRLGNPPAGEVLSLFEHSLAESLARIRLDRVDLFLLHNQIIPDGSEDRSDETQSWGTPRRLFTEAVLPAFEKLVSDGRIGAWGITGIGVPGAVLETINSDPVPGAVQAVANLLDSPGAMIGYDGPAQPRDIIAAAQRTGHGGDGNQSGSSWSPHVKLRPRVAR